MSDLYSFVFEVQVNGVSIALSGYTPSQNTGLFHTTSFVFTPTASSTVLRFGETSSRGVIDNILITAVPEPGSLALLGMGLGVLGFTRRKAR